MGSGAEFRRWAPPDTPGVGIASGVAHKQWLSSLGKGTLVERWVALRDAVLALPTDWQSNLLYLTVHARLRRASDLYRKANSRQEPYRAHCTRDAAVRYREAAEDLDRCLGALYDARKDVERALEVERTWRQQLARVTNEGTWAGAARGAARRPVSKKD